MGSISATLNNSLTILAYNRIYDMGDEDSFPFDPELISSTPDQFEEQIKYVKRYFNIFFFHAEDDIRLTSVTGVQTCALPICRHGETDPPVRSAKCQRCGEIIDDQGHNPRPVDRIDRRQVQFITKGCVVEHRLHQILAIVERTPDSNRSEERRGG